METIKSRYIRQMVVQSDYGAVREMKVYFDARSHAVIVAKQGATVAMGAWDGERLALTYNHGFLQGDKLDVEFALRIEAQP